MAPTGWTDIEPSIQEFLLSCDEPRQELTADRLPRIKTKVDNHGGNLMHWAARRGLVSMIDFLMNNLDSTGVRELSTTRDNLGNTPLHYACRGNYVKFVERLLGTIPDNDVPNFVLVINQGGVSALHWACRYGDVHVMKILLEPFDCTTDARPCEIVDEIYGTTALHWACRYGKHEIVRLLLKTCPEEAKQKMIMLRSKNAKLDDDCPDEAHFEAQRAYGSVGTDSVTDHVVLPKTNGGSTALHWACLHGHTNVVRVFIEELDDSSFYELCAAQDDIVGNTVIHWICGRGHLPVLNHIITAQKKRFNDLLWIQSNDKNTALHWACGRGHLDVFKKIAEEIGDDFHEFIMKTNERGESALHWACNTGYHLIVAAILERLEPSAKEFIVKTVTKSENSTALHWACHHDHITTVEQLFSHLSPDAISDLVQIKNNRGLTALHVACSYGHADIVDKFKGLNSFLLLKLVADNDNEYHRCAIETVIAHKQFATLSVLLSSDHALFENILQKIEKNVVVSACRRGENDAVHSLLDAAHKSDRTGNLLYQFLKAEDDEGKNVFHIACNRRDRKVIKHLLWFLHQLQPKKADHNVRDILCHTDNLRKTVLLECSHRVDERIVQMILDEAVKFECVPELLKNSFWDAFASENHTVVTCLLKQAEKSKCLREVLFHTDSRHRNRTVIHRSCQHRYGDIKCLKYVIDVAKRNDLLLQLLCKEDTLGRTFLFYTEDARSDIIHILVKSLNVLDAKYTEKDICHWFLTNRDKQNKTVLHTTPANRTQYLCHFFTPLYEDLSRQSSPPVNNSAQVFKDEDFVLSPRDMPKISAEFENIVEKKPPSDFRLIHNKQPFAHGKRARSSLLDIMGSTGCLELIQHNYTQAYLQVCWHRFVKNFFLVNSALYALLMLFVTGFVVSHQFQVPNDDHDSNVSATTKSPSFHSSIQFSIIPKFTDVCHYLLIVASILIGTNEILQMCAKGRNYWKTPGNYADIAVTVGSLVISLATIISGYQPWVHQLGVVTMCVTWINGAWMMTLIGFKRFQKVNLMFVMLFRVIKSIIYFLPVFVVFIVCMALSYYSLMHNQPSFQNLGYSLMKSLTMTVGEMEFTAMFFPDDEVENPPFYVLTCFMFVVFLGIMNIAVINLLVGRAVGDIQRLNSQSEIVAFQSMVDLTKESQAMAILIRKLKCKLSSPREMSRSFQPIDVDMNGPESISLTSSNSSHQHVETSI